MHDGRQRVRRLRGERRNIAFLVERYVARTVGVMIWGAIAYGSRSPLVFIQGSMTAVRYVEEVLEPVAIPCVQNVPGGIFQQDNARPHDTMTRARLHIPRVALRSLQEANVELLPWPLRSLDLSPIEHVWDAIGWRLTALEQTLGELKDEILAAWAAVPQKKIDNLIRSMPRRVTECIHERGGSTHY